MNYLLKMHTLLEYYNKFIAMHPQVLWHVKIVQAVNMMWHAKAYNIEARNGCNDVDVN